jgi:hypothetical protein
MLAPAFTHAAIVDTFHAVEGGNPDILTNSFPFGVTKDFFMNPFVNDPIGSRRQFLVQSRGVAPGTLAIQGNGVASFHSAALNSEEAAAAVFWLKYGVGTPALAFDASPAGEDRFRITFSQPNSDYSLILSIDSPTGGGSATVALSASSFEIEYPLVSFSNAANIDFHNLSQVQLFIQCENTRSASDLAITKIETVVPEPGTCFLAAGGLLGLSCSRRRRG